MQVQYLVENISCGHCTNTIETELSAMSEVTSVSADKTSKLVTVDLVDDSSVVAIEAMLVEIGFTGARQ